MKTNWRDSASFDDNAGTAPSAPASGSATPSAATAPAVSSPAASTPSATPTPASSPTPAPTPTPAPAGGEADFDFGSILEGNTDSELSPTGVVEAPLAVAPAAPVAAPVVPPAVAPAAPVAAQPTSAPQPPAPASPVQQDASPPLNPADPRAIADAITANEPAIIDHVAATVFALSPEEIEALETNAVEAVPRLMAKCLVRAQQNLLSQLPNLIPRMIQTHMQVQQRNDENANKFYSAWPGLKKAEHGTLVNRLAHSYRQMNPSASLDQMIQDVGAMVMVAAKVPAAATNGVGVPAHPMAPAVAALPQPAAFSPAQGGPASSPSAPEENPWGFLGGENEG